MPHVLYNVINQKYIVIKLAATTGVASGRVEVSIILPDTVAPSSTKNESTDNRLLGISINTISVIPSDPKLAPQLSKSFYATLSTSLQFFIHKLSLTAFPLVYFDGLSYLKAYPDVQKAVETGQVSSALSHFILLGIKKRYKLFIAIDTLPNEGNKSDIALSNHNETR